MKLTSRSLQKSDSINFISSLFSEKQSKDRELWVRYKEYRNKYAGSITNRSFHFWKNNGFKDNEKKGKKKAAVAVLSLIQTAKMKISLLL